MSIYSCWDRYRRPFLCSFRLRHSSCFNAVSTNRLHSVLSFALIHKIFKQFSYLSLGLTLLNLPVTVSTSALFVNRSPSIHSSQLALSCKFPLSSPFPQIVQPRYKNQLFGSVTSFPVLYLDHCSVAQPKAPPCSPDLFSVHVCQIFPSILVTGLEGLHHGPLLQPGHRRRTTCGECPS